MKKGLIVLGIVTLIIGGIIIGGIYVISGTEKQQISGQQQIVKQQIVKQQLTAEQIRVTLDVPGMTCAVCPITIKKALKKTPGVVEVLTSLDTKTAIIIFNKNETSIGKLIEATTNAGYPSTLKKES